MISFLQGFFQSIAEFFSNIWNILTFIFDEMTQFFLIVKQSIVFFHQVLGSLPTIFVVFGIAMLTVLIIYVVIGRNAGGD